MSPYVLNTWYPLTWSRNVGRALSANQIVEQRVVLYRTEAGQVVAMEDACPHRLMPLSMGKLKGDAIECGYPYRWRLYAKGSVDISLPVKPQVGIRHRGSPRKVIHEGYSPA